MPEDNVGSSWTTGERRAYEIDASDYRPPLEPLVSPRNDADAIADLLEGSHGYLAARNRLTSGTVGKAEILALLEKMVADVAHEDRVVFYFAGHGVPPDVTASRAGYLVPENAEWNNSDTFLSMDEVYDRLALLPCRHLLVILDCCFAGCFRWARTRPVRDLGEVYEHGEVLVVAADGRRVRRFPEHSGLISALAYSPDGTLLASSGENSIWLTNAETGRTVAILLDRHRSSVNALAFDATGELLAAGYVVGTILLFDLPTRQPLVLLR